jgi:glycosyltransferase involved in cell wall biosynthesis
MAKVSIIVPVYNSSRYLYKCINSLLNQSLKDIEIILIDDKSSDASLSIIEKYEKMFPNVIKVLKNTDNRGAGYSRNRGLSAATGEYIGFVDSDDYVEHDMYEKMYRTAINNDDDIVIVGMDLRYLGINLSCLGRSCDYPINNINIKENKEYLVYTKPSCCNKIYRKELIKTEKFVEGLKWEDYPFTINLISKSGKIENLRDASYHYRINPLGTTCSDLKKVNNKILDIFTCSDIIEEKMTEEGLLKHFINELRTIQIVNCLGRVRDLLFANISKDEKTLLMNYLINLIEVKYGDWKSNEWYILQKQLSYFYGMRMNYIEEHFLDRNLRKESNEVTINENIKKILHHQ